MKNSDKFAIGSVFIVAILLIVLGPWACIWALNTLFSLTIPFTFKTWAAINVLVFILGGSKFSRDKK